MQVRTKFKLLNAVQSVFPIWALKKKALVVEHSYDAKLAQEKNRDERERLEFERHDEAIELWHEIAALRSIRLVDKARKLYIPVNALNWSTDEYNNKFLDSEAQATLHRTIVDEQRKVWEFRFKIIGALTGLFGTLIGVLAFLAQFVARSRHR